MHELNVLTHTAVVLVISDMCVHTCSCLPGSTLTQEICLMPPSSMSVEYTVQLANDLFIIEKV